MITKKMSAIDPVSQVASCGAAFCFPTFHHVAKENEKVMVVLNCVVLNTCQLKKWSFVAPLVPHFHKVVMRAEEGAI